MKLSAEEEVRAWQLLDMHHHHREWADRVLRVMRTHGKAAGREELAALQQAVKRAYRKAALRLHPDRPTGNARDFDLVTRLNRAMQQLGR